MLKWAESPTLSDCSGVAWHAGHEVPERLAFDQRVTFIPEYTRSHTST